MIEVRVRYDDRDIARAPAYFGCLGKYSAVGIGHSNGTSSMFFQQRIDRKKLAADLGDIPIIAVR